MADFKRRFKDLLGFGGNESVAYDDSAILIIPTMMKQKIRRRKRRKTHLCLLRVILQEMRPVLLRPM